MPADDGKFGLAGLLETPVVETDFVYQGLLDFIGGLEIAGVTIAQVVVFDPFLGCEAEGFGAEIVFTGILTGDGLPAAVRGPVAPLGGLAAGGWTVDMMGKTPSQKEKSQGNARLTAGANTTP